MDMKINKTVLMSGVEYFDDGEAINPFMDKSVPIDIEKARAEHDAIREALQKAGVRVIQVKPPIRCQDGVFTANWALVRGNKAVMASLPEARKAEEPYAQQVLRDLGKEIYTIPDGLKFSGQGDALPCGNLLFCGSGYRSDPEAQAFVCDTLGYERIQLQAVPQRDWLRRPVINKTSGWPDSFFYDLDLAISILKFPEGEQKGLIAWCPDAFLPASQRLLRDFDGVDKIEVSLKDVRKALCCNLVSTGETVIMNDGAPEFTASVQAHGLKTITLRNPELAKGGGSMRCTTLTLDTV